MPLTVGVVGDVPTVIAKLPDEVPHVLVKLIPTFPETAVELHVVVILLVPCPAVIVKPVGTDQTYVAPACAVML